MRTLAFWLGDRWRDNFEYDAAKTPCEQVLLTGQMCYYESRLQEQFLEDKGLRDLGAVSYLGTPLLDSAGRVIGHLCVMDVNPLADDPRTRSVVTIFAARAAAELERKRAEDALRESEGRLRESELRFRALIEHSSDAIALVNDQIEVFYASPATSRILGYQAEELVGRNPLEIVHPDDIAATKRGLQQLIRQPGRVMQYIHRALHQDGEWRWIESIGTNLLNEPSVRAIVINYRDVTERKQAEEEQAQLQSIAQNVAREWRLTFDAVEFPILLIDFEGNVARLNHAAMILAGRDYRDLRGIPVETVGSGEPWRLISEMIAKVRASRSSVSHTIRDPATARTWEIAASLFSGFEEGEKENNCSRT
jgi:PAS domain S-box-containing protein